MLYHLSYLDQLSGHEDSNVFFNLKSNFRKKFGLATAFFSAPKYKISLKNNQQDTGIVAMYGF